MPLRVRCRCGQELVIRYSEWVYVLVALALVATLGNTLVVLLLLLRPGAPEPPETRAGPPGSNAPAEAGEAEPRPPASGEGPEAPTAATGPGPAPDGGSPTSSPPAAGAGEASPGPAPDPGPEPASAPGIALREPPASAESSRDAPAPPDPSAVDALLAQLDLLPAGQETSGGPAAGARDEVAPRPLLEAPPVVRALLLAGAPGAPDLAFAALLDPDPVVRRLAVERALEVTPEDDAPESRPRRAFVVAAGGRLRATADGKRLLRAWGAEDVPPEPPPDDAWERAERLAGARLEAATGLAQLAEDLEARREAGWDVVLAVDVSHSMDPALSELQAAAAWLLPALEWGLPGLRAGLVLYRDEVVATAGFSSRPSREVLPRLLAARATGGGDVPEGVHVALRQALRRGTFDWREEAQKHIVLLGDQPPPYAEKRGVESLVAAARSQGGYHLHALGIGVEDGVPFFAGFAESGGGRTGAVAGTEAAAEILHALLGEAHESTGRRIAPLLRRLFGDGSA